jgi:hypothetical protein
MGVGVLAAEQVGSVILYVDGLCIGAMWMLEAKTSDCTGEAGVKAMKGMAWVFIGEGHDDVTKVALDREDGDPVVEKSESMSLDVMKAESSASESAASGESAKQARSVRRLGMCESEFGRHGPWFNGWRS